MFCQKFVTQIKSRIVTIKIVVTFFAEEPKSHHFVNEWGPLKNNWKESIFQSGRQKMKRVERFFKGLWQRGEVGTSNYRVKSD